ncbi:hypothetical protein [Streptomyces sp. bgisy060]|uniref:hypothetical protein n=1 Tax=Streptomyces sp. bgisy060 TaxID=3413775 RepID=UPI003EBC3814
MAGTTAPQRTRKSRRPTGLPNPPLVLLTGLEKTGKSFAAAQGTGSELIGRSYWIEIGGTEGTADYYGRIPGADYEIVPHDGSYQDILDAIRWVNHQPRVDGKPNMLIIDSMTCLWDMLSDEVARFARNRAVRKAQRNRTRAPALDDPVVVDADLWNRAKDRWGEVLWLLRRHQGPCLLLARTEVVTAFENDKPTRNTTRKVKAERNLPAAVDATVDLHAIGEAWLTGVRSLHMNVRPGESQRLENFTVDGLLRQLGLQDATDARSASELRPDATLGEPVPAAPTAPRPDPAPTAPRPDPVLTSDQAAELIRRALMHQTHPETALRECRETYGRMLLRTVPTQTAWGAMSADELIDRALQHLKDKADEAASTGGGQQQGTNETTKSQPSTPGPDPVEATSTTPGPDLVEATSTTSSPTPEPGPEEALTPPDPKPETSASESEPDAFEDVTEAEQPQDLAPRAPQGRPAHRNRADRRVMTVLLTEAEIQARIFDISRDEHLAPITLDNNPPTMTKLRNHVVRHRPNAITLLESNGHQDIADTYRRAGTPELKIAQLFTPLFGDLSVTE